MNVAVGFRPRQVRYPISIRDHVLCSPGMAGVQEAPGPFGWRRLAHSVQRAHALGAEPVVAGHRVRVQRPETLLALAHGRRRAWIGFGIRCGGAPGLGGLEDVGLTQPARVVGWRPSGAGMLVVAADLLADRAGNVPILGCVLAFALSSVAREDLDGGHNDRPEVRDAFSAPWLMDWLRGSECWSVIGRFVLSRISSAYRVGPRGRCG